MRAVWKALAMVPLLLHVFPCKGQQEITFDKVQVMHSEPDIYPRWGNTASFIPARTIKISARTIEFTTDRIHRLAIVGKMAMPSKNIIYECRDPDGNDVRVFLIHDSKMFVYYKNFHLLLHFRK